jgi:hypothetical protein
MAFLFRPTIPTEGLEGLSLPADASPIEKSTRHDPDLPASAAETATPDEATLEEFLLRNFLT